MNMNNPQHTGETENMPPDNMDIAWNYSTGNMRLYAPPIVFHGAVYVLGPSLFALDARTGAKLWSYPIARAQNFIPEEKTNWHYWSEWSSPAVYGDRIFIVSSLDNTLVSLDLTPEDGSDDGIADTEDVDYDLIWKYDLVEEHLFGSRSSPLVIDGVLYAGTAAGDLIALDVKDDSYPELLWSCRIATRIDSSPAYYNDKVFVGTWDIRNRPGSYAYNESDRYFYAFDATPEDGIDDGTPDPGGAGYDIVWRVRLGDLIWSSATIDKIQKMVFIGCSDRKLYAFDIETGAQKWNYTANGPVYSAPALHENKIFFGTTEPGNTLYALEARTGELIWKHEADEKVAASPVCANGVVYSAVMDGRINAFDAKGSGDGTTALLSTIQLPGRVRATPVIAHKHLFVSCWDGNLYSIGRVPAVDIVISGYDVIGDSREATIEFALINLGEGEIVDSRLYIYDGRKLLNESEVGVFPPGGKYNFAYVITEPDVRAHFYKIRLNYTDAEGYEHVFFHNKTAIIEKYTIPSFIPGPGAPAVILIMFAVAMVIKHKLRRRCKSNGRTI